MSKDDERPQFNPKHRIAGAIILVSLAVIFVPMLLDESAPPKENQSLTEIPARDTPSPDTKVVVTPVPVADPTTTQTAGAEPVAEMPAAETPPASNTPSNTTPRTDTAKSEPKTTTAVAKKSDTTAKAKSVSAKSSDASDKLAAGWIVQVGTFANTDNAEHLRDKLKSRGFTVHSESITVQGSKALRLRVGPYRDKSAAAKAQSQLQKDFSVQGMVLAYP